VLTYSFGIVLVPMQRDLGWSRIELTGAFSLALAVSALAGVVVGAALDRYSPRALLTGGSLLGSALVLAWSQVHNRIELYLIFAGLGLAMAVLLYNSVFAIVTKWFRGRRREALTTVALAGAFASFIFSPLAGKLTVELGWREALMVLAAILAVVTIPVHAVLLRPAHREPEEDPVARSNGTVRAVIGSRRFWQFALALALGSFTWSVIVVQLVPFLLDQGRSVAFAAFAAGLVGIGQLPGRLVFVAFGRMLGGSSLPVASFGLAALALGLLTVNRSEAAVLSFAIAFGTSAGLLTLMTASVPSDLYGQRIYGIVSGVIYACSNGARAAAPIASSAVAMLPGHYTTLLGLLISLSVVATLLGGFALHTEQPRAR